jgi:ribosomal protein L3 glutamine methyltransferase
VADSAKTVGSVVAEVAEEFERAQLVFGHGTDNAWDEATALVLGLTGFPDDQAYQAEPLSQGQCEAIADLVWRRIQDREPLAYLLGKIRYAGYEFFCEPGVVIPRSPIAQLIAAQFRPWLSGLPQTIVDVCCGTGCLGILCAHAFPRAKVVLLDVDPVAVALAQRNVAAHNLEHRVQAVTSDLLSALRPGSVDLLVSNPPYVDAADISTLPAEYRHEPRLGLAGGADGLDVVARLMAAAAERLTADAVFVCEVGASAPAVFRRYPQTAFIWPDLPAGGEGVFVLPGSELTRAVGIGQRP